VALLTGLVFARFARPTAALMFSDVAVIAPYQGVTAFEFRIANARSNQLMELEAKVLYSRLDGVARRFDQLKLERTKVVFFPLSWTIVHPIDESSPLWGLTRDDLVEHDAEFDILMGGIDEHFSQMVHARSSYKPEEIVFGARFANIYNPVAADGTISIDVSRLSDVEEASLDDDATHRHTQSFRHTGHFSGFVAPPPGRAPGRLLSWGAPAAVPRGPPSILRFTVTLCCSRLYLFRGSGFRGVPTENSDGQVGPF
jgi:hypothetical protein